MSFRWIIAFFLVSILLFSCDSSRVFEKNIDIKNYAWEANDTLSFTVDISDVSKPLNSYINVRHRFEYGWRNLWLTLSVQYPNDSLHVFPINIPLSEPNGHWFGNCRGDVCMLQMPLDDNNLIALSDTGTYTIKINHEMRELPLKGIMSVGLRIDNNELKNEPK